MDPLGRYLAHGYATISGMSSALAAEVCASLLRFQTRSGVHGPVAEIGVYEGRFFIVLALAAAPGERCVAFDPFDWPDCGVRARFLDHCRRHGVATGDLVSVSARSSDLDPALFRRHLGAPARFIHIDGDHKSVALLHDLELAKAALAPAGIVCLDDMLHPLYPDLTVAAAEFLSRERDFRVLAVIDRQSFQGACKYLICRTTAAAACEAHLAAAFAGRIKAKRADFRSGKALIIAA